MEIHTVMDLILHSSRCLAQSTGGTLGLVVVGQRGLWLNLSTMVEKDKAHFLYQPVDPKGMFGPALATMQQRFEGKKKEAFSSFEPCRAIATIGNTSSHFYTCRSSNRTSILAGSEEEKYILMRGVPYDQDKQRPPWLRKSLV